MRHPLALASKEVSTAFMNYQEDGTQRTQPSPKVQARFWAKVDLQELEPSECWLWMACKTHDGYGLFWFQGRLVYAHRFIYEWLVGPIPDGLQLDHVQARGCAHRHCVNPAHLEVVSQSENMRRGEGGKYLRDKTHCPQGHAYAGDNLYITTRGGRLCRECHRNASRASYHRARKRQGQPEDRPRRSTATQARMLAESGG